MELTFLEQSTAFIYSLLLGACLGALYGAIKFFRTAFSFGKIALFTADFLFMLISSLAVFVFSVAYLLGYLRIYTVIGSALGFFAYRLTLGRLFARVYCPLIKLGRKAINKILLKIKFFAKKLLKIGGNILYNIFISRGVFRSKRKNSCKKEDNSSDDKIKEKQTL